MIEVPGETPTFPTMTLGETLVTAEAPNTVKLAKSVPSNGVAHTWVAPHSVPITAHAKLDKYLNEPILDVLFGCLIVMVMVITLKEYVKRSGGIMKTRQKTSIIYAKYEYCIITM